MGYKEKFKVGDLLSSDTDISKALSRADLLEVIGYKNICNIFHIKVKSMRTNRISDYPAMHIEYHLKNHGNKRVVQLLYSKLDK